MIIITGALRGFGLN